MTGELFFAVLAGYMIAVGAIGFYGYAHTNDEADFLVAGRDIGPYLGGATLSATQMSAGTFVGAFGIHYLFGVGFIWVWTGLWLGWLASLLLVAPQMRTLGRMTVPDYLAERYSDDGADGDYARLVGAVLIVVVYTVFLTAQVTAGALVFRAVLGVPELYGVAGMVVLSIGYTMFGGMRASVLTDLLQVLVMVTALLVALPITFSVIGGLSELNATLASLDPSLVGQSFATSDILGFIVAFALVRLSSPRAISRFYTMRDEQTVRRSIVVSLVIQSIVAVCIALLGLATRVLFPTLTTPDIASVVMGLNVFGPVLSALFIAAILSATLSTVDSIMLVSAAALAHDVYGEVLRPSATERRKLLVNRAAVIVVGALPAALALNRELVGGLVQFIAILQASLMGGTFVIPFLLGLHWRRATTAGALAGMIAGFATVVGWHMGTDVYSYIPPEADALAGDPVVPGVIASLLVFVTVSLMGPKPSPRSLAAFFDTERDD